MTWQKFVGDIVWRFVPLAGRCDMIYVNKGDKTRLSF